MAGMRVDTDQGREILRSAGAQVDDATRIVRFPAQLVEESLARAPRELTLGARRPEWSHPTCAGLTTLVASGEAPAVRDRETGEVRPSTHADFLQGMRLIDALDDVGVFWAMVSGFSHGDTLGDEVSYFATVQRGFSKHVQDSSDNVAAMPWQLEVLDAVFGGRDEVARRHPYSFLLTPVSPLVIEKGHTEACLALRGWDIPVAILPMPMTGATAPGSLAATVLLANCEILGCLCLLQAAEPGTPIIYAPAMMTMNPRSGLWTGHAPHDLLSAAGTEMARHYGLPSMASGCDSDHFVPGMQAGYEKALSGLVPMLARPDLIVGPGTSGQRHRVGRRGDGHRLRDHAHLRAHLRRDSDRPGAPLRRGARARRSGRQLPRREDHATEPAPGGALYPRAGLARVARRVGGRGTARLARPGAPARGRAARRP